MRRSGDDEGVTLVRMPMAAMQAIAAIKGDDAVEYAEPNWIYTHQATSNDPLYTNGSLWGMYSSTGTPTNQFGIAASSVWAKTTDASAADCRSVWIGIIDEGYFFNHVDLVANAAKNPGDNTIDGNDNDGNGFVDDVYGWDFAGGNNTVYDGTGDDHGTHVAGTIGAQGGNSTGVAGVCWRVNLMNAKFLGANGGTTADAIAAVDYFTELKARHGLNFVATNNSWGGGGFSQALASAIARGVDKGILFVAAAGNNGRNIDLTPSYPASYADDGIISVASITSTGALSSFSNFGATSVDIAAPGSGINSTIPKSGKSPSGYASYNGTSMATPHVTGALALYASRNTLKPLDRPDALMIRSRILAAILPTSSLNGRVATNGRLNVSGF
jgi:subtilisin family serine protease